MPSREEFRIVKIPLQERPADIQPNFPRQPQLYLELIENKSKIRPELVNKDYEPPRGVEMEPNKYSPSWQPARYAASPAGSRSSRSRSPARSHASDASEDTERSRLSARERLLKRGTPYAAKYGSQEGKKAAESGDAAGSSNGGAVESSSARGAGQRLPTLTELETQNKVQRQKEFIDIDKMKHDDDNLKRELLFKLDILRKSYPNAEIEKFTIHDKLSIIQEYYDGRLRMLSLENSVDNYKQYMIFLFMGVEALFGKVFKLSMDGFTQQQMMDMHKYEKLLIELGSKSYMPSAKQWPVELRLVFLVIIQTAFFVVGKMVLGNQASKILSAVTDMRAGGVGAAPSRAAGARRMRGPRVNLEDLPDTQI